MLGGDSCNYYFFIIERKTRRKKVERLKLHSIEVVVDEIS